jgi:hypothetical protein
MSKGVGALNVIAMSLKDLSILDSAGLDLLKDTRMGFTFPPPRILYAISDAYG